MTAKMASTPTAACNANHAQRKTTTTTHKRKKTHAGKGPAARTQKKKA
jgi:hypothetical protein